MRRLELWSRAGCHLCLEMETLVRSVVEARPDVLLVVRDVDDLGGDAGSRSEHERMTTLVPVLVLDGEEIAHWRIGEDELRAALRR